MKFQDNYSKEAKRKKFFFYFLLLIPLIIFLNYFKINKFYFIGDTQFIDIQKLKILSLNLLKDQPIFWFDKKIFQENVKNEFPQVKEISFKILNADTIEINVDAEDICCIVKDIKDKKYVIAKSGNVLREYEGIDSSEIKINYVQDLILNQMLNQNLINLVYLISTKSVKFDEVRENEIYLEKELIYFYSLDSKQILINENTDLKKINENIKSMKSYLQQNQKNYSILDFRFEKIVVK